MSQVFCLYIRVKLKSEMIEEFLQRFGVLAAHVKANEPDTLSYELCRSDQNEDEFMIVERYPSRAELESAAPTERGVQGFQGVVDQQRVRAGEERDELPGNGRGLHGQVNPH